MKIAVFSTKRYDRETLLAPPGYPHELVYLEPRLTVETAPLAAGFDGVCLFVHDQADRATLSCLAEHGCRLVALRCAGYNHVDLAAAASLGMAVVRVPAYSPYAVAEHAVGLILSLNRHFHRAHARVRDNNFSLDGFLGFDVHGKTVGVIGTGKIGQCFIQIMLGFGCRVLAYDLHRVQRLEEQGVEYRPFAEVMAEADIVSLHCPLTPQTHHLMNAQTLGQMKRGAMLINTSRGPLIDAVAVIEALKSGWLGYLGIDVYEEEEGVFFEDYSNRIITDDVLMRLNTFPNVLMTSHQAYFTREAVANIAATTLHNIEEFARTGTGQNLVRPESVVIP